MESLALSWTPFPGSPLALRAAACMGHHRHFTDAGRDCALYHVALHSVEGHSKEDVSFVASAGTTATRLIMKSLIFKKELPHEYCN